MMTSAGNPMGARGSGGSTAEARARLATWMEEPVHFEPARPSFAFRTIWISDTHLGTAGCRAELLLDFLIGALDDDLAEAIRRALGADRGAAAAESRHYGWDRCVARFVEGLAPALGGRAGRNPLASRPQLSAAQV